MTPRAAVGLLEPDEVQGTSVAGLAPAAWAAYLEAADEWEAVHNSPWSGEALEQAAHAHKLAMYNAWVAACKAVLLSHGVRYAP